MRTDQHLLTPDLLDMLSNSISDGLFTVDSKGRILKINSSFTSMLGYREEDITNMYIHDIGYTRNALSQEIQRHFDANFELYLINRAEKTVLPMILRHKNGHAVPGNLKSFILRSSSGKVCGAFGIISIRKVDVQKFPRESERELIERIWETEENYKNILEYSGDAIMIAEFNTRIITVNQAAVRMLGYEKADEIVGRHLMEIGPIKGTFTSTTGETVILGDEFQSQQLARTNELFERGAVKMDTYLFKKDHKIVPIEATISLLKNQQGDIRASITIFRDITSRKVAATRLKQAHDSLEQKVKERTQDLEEANTALRVLVKGNEEDRILLEKKILANVNNLLLPYIEKIKESKLNEHLTSYVNILESNLNDIISPFSEKLSSKLLKLTPTEIRIANLVRQGLTSKEIAGIMSLSVETIGTHRKKIRKKMGLSNKEANLQSYLLSI